MKAARSLLFFCVFSLLFSPFGLSSQNPVIIKSDYLPHNDSVFVFVPQGMNEGNLLPLVILLHGWSGKYYTWHDITNCQTLADSFQMIIVCPDGFYDSWYMNHPLRSDLRYADYFKEDFLPYIKSNYPVDTGKVFISGLSMGGFGSLYLATLNPGLFRAVGSMSGVFDLSRKVLNKRGLNDVDTSREFWKDKGIFSILSESCLPAIPVYADCGRDDIYLDDTILLGTLAQSCKLDYIIEIYDGKHNRDFWKESVFRHLTFFSDVLQKQH